MLIRVSNQSTQDGEKFVEMRQHVPTHDLDDVVESLARGIPHPRVIVVEAHDDRPQHVVHVLNAVLEVGINVSFQSIVKVTISDHGYE